jgi:drug/metabolite transporter (DMT)-like permease
VKSATSRALASALGASLLFGAMSTGVRLASHNLGAAEVALFRALFGLVFALPLFAVAGRDLLVIRHRRLYLMRCATSAASMCAGFWAIAHLPLATAVALSYSAPIFATCLARWFFREEVGAARWTAVLAGFGGILIIARPHGFAQPGVIAALTAALLTALSSLQIRRLSMVESTERIVFWSNVGWLCILLPSALPEWHAPAGAWGWLLLAGASGTGAQLLWTRALADAEVSAVMPLSYVQLPFVALLGYALFNENVSVWTAVGGATVAGSTLIMVRAARTRQLKTRSR